VGLGKSQHNLHHKLAEKKKMEEEYAGFIPIDILFQ
jgi:hypothetical protein